MKRAFVFVIDLFALYFSLYLTLLARYGSNFDAQLNYHLTPFSLLFVFWIIYFYISNLYDISYIRNDVNFYSRFFQTIAVSAGFSVAFFYLIPFFGITPKTNLFIFILIFGAVDFTLRSIYNNLVLSNTFKNNAIVVGLDGQSVELARFIKENPQFGFKLLYAVDLSENEGSQEDASEFGIIKENNLEKIINQEKINTVILSPAAYRLPRVIDAFYKTLDKKISFYNLSDFYEHLTGKIPLGAINQAWFLEKLSEGSKKPYEFAKRIFDVFFSALFGSVILIFIPLIALVIKFDSSGSVFFRQKRIGQYGKIFEIVKLRTMLKDAEKNTGAVWAKENDSRITKVGKFLRKTRIDELPQLWNIFKGEMSFVGPRAERPEFHEELKSGIPYYNERYLVRPGLTGWAQIKYQYGASVKDAEEKLQYDLYYIKNRSLVLDFSSVLKTINIVLRRAGR